MPEFRGCILIYGNRIPESTQTGISSTMELRSDLLSNPEYLSRGILRGTSPNFTLGAGDNQIAQQLAEAFSTNQTYAAITDGPPSTTTTFSGYAGTILSFNAASASDAEATFTFENAFFETLELKLQSETGVNLDEELANMVVFQNAYNASARVVQTVDELFDVLLSIA